MHVSPQDFYRDKIQQVEKELAEKRKLLKKQGQMHPKERKRLRQRICQLYEDLKDWKNRAAFYDPYLSPTR